MSQLRLPTPMTLLWVLRRCAWTLGWIPMLISGMLLLIWAGLLQQQAAQETQINMLQSDIRQLAIKPVEQAPQETVVIEKEQTVTPEPVQLSMLWQQLPAFSDLSPRMIQIANLAQKRQILLNVGDYQWQAHQVKDASHDIQQFDMRFTIQADYITCRQFILDVLRKYPSMALTGLELRKNETVQPTIDATLTFSVFIRGGQSHAS
ncbi:hypothetical protein [Methylophilus sp. TWE2]|uniref:hypothetical protein n=1 Tax=Methylophilus sp. TWE2 TaxID=1662285 RepID=UPI0006708F5C|nr:hypothetical protein [Methylophilus sp. TWE2]AKR43883.1 hypothetical protein ACJ67_10970 [Methylophilus sp. TWE2]